MVVRRIAPIGLVVVLVFLGNSAQAAEECWIDPISATLVCETGGIEPTTPPVVPPRDDDPGRRYVYTDTAPGVGDCYYWSDVPGGLDAWDPANDPAVIAITTSLPVCPVVIVDVETRAWEVFRSWDLDPPNATLTPSVGVTGVPTYLASSTLPAITHSEALPDGRTLEVRARTALLTVDWGDGASAEFDPRDAEPFPDGTVVHSYIRKTCSQQYRDTHASGALCHPTLEAYPIEASYVWVGEYSIGTGWTPLGTLTVTTELLYDVDEARGQPVP